MYPTLISSYFLFCEIQRGTYRSPKPPRQLKIPKAWLCKITRLFGGLSIIIASEDGCSAAIY